MIGSTLYKNVCLVLLLLLLLITVHLGFFFSFLSFFFTLHGSQQSDP